MSLASVRRYVAAKAPLIHVTCADGEFRITFTQAAIRAAFPELTAAQCLDKAEWIAAYESDAESAMDTAEAMARVGLAPAPADEVTGIMGALETVAESPRFTLRHRMGRVDVLESGEVANGGTAHGFNSERAARAWIAEFTANESAEARPLDELEAGPCPVCGGETAYSDGFRNCLDCDYSDRPAEADEQGAETVRRDSVEYHAGRAAWQAGEGSAANPYPKSDRTDSRAARWTLGHLEASRESGKVETIDATPTWAAILPILCAALENGTDEGRRIARAELQRMAALADERNALVSAA